MAIGSGVVKAVCISEKRGTPKIPVESAELEPGKGIVNDAHAGSWHRQVSLLSWEKTQEFRLRGAEIVPGSFGENLLVSGIDLRTVPVGSRLRIGEDIVLEVTQIGKACHDRCRIYQTVGDCIMPREGIFARVLTGGTVRAGDRAAAELPDPARPFTVAVITVSDRASSGEYPDLSGPVLRTELEAKGFEVLEQLIVPDCRQKLEEELKRLSDQRQISLILTTGGTGLSERDVTPEATKAVCEREVPGIGEALRAYSRQFTEHAMLSRQTAGIRGKTLIVNIPGSPKACRENAAFLLPLLPHGLGVLRGTESS